MTRDTHWGWACIEYDRLSRWDELSRWSHHYIEPVDGCGGWWP